MTPAQEKRFKKLTKDMAALLQEMEADHSHIGFFIEDGVPCLINARPQEEPKKCILAMGEYWHRSGGGGF